MGTLSISILCYCVSLLFCKIVIKSLLLFVHAVWTRSKLLLWSNHPRDLLTLTPEKGVVAANYCTSNWPSCECVNSRKISLSLLSCVYNHVYMLHRCCKILCSVCMSQLLLLAQHSNIMLMGNSNPLRITIHIPHSWHTYYNQHCPLSVH